MGRKVFAWYCQSCTDEKAVDSWFLANAFSGYCCAIACQVRDETYIKVKGRWMYLCRSVDKYGKTLDFMLSKRRDKASARLFFRRALDLNGLPSRIVIDKSGANLAGLQRINIGLKLSRTKQRIEILRVKYLNNIVEQDHRFIKKVTRPMLGFKAFDSAVATLAGIEAAHLIRKGQLGQTGISPLKQFAAFAG